MIKHFFTCPFCWTEISILIDPSQPEQQYIEDCENCCRPIEFKIEFTDGQLTLFEANPAYD